MPGAPARLEGRRGADRLRCWMKSRAGRSVLARTSRDPVGSSSQRPRDLVEDSRPSSRIRTEHFDPGVANEAR
jgi:hypothetical protein